MQELQRQTILNLKQHGMQNQKNRLPIPNKTRTASNPEIRAVVPALSLFPAGAVRTGWRLKIRP